MPIGHSLARWKGLEPLTYWFVASHSIQLSYQREYGADDEARPLRFACGTHTVTETFPRNVSLALLVPFSSLGKAIMP